MFTLNDILTGCEGAYELHSTATPDANQTFPSAQHDSRQIGKGDLFVAIKGAQVDGNKFIAKAALAGAGAALCTDPASDAPSDFLQIVVPDIEKALHATARVRADRQRNTVFIGITGSYGKTGTKEAVAAVLSRKAPTLKTYASYNNEIGYPLTLLRLEDEHRFAVLEMGAQWVGELAWLCNTIHRPDWSIITTVGVAHIEHFGSPENILKAKTELVQCLTPEGIAILNYDNEKTRSMHDKTQARVIMFGQGEGADVRATEIHGDALRGFGYTLNFRGEQAHVQLHLPGFHSINISLAAAATGLLTGLPISEVAEALETLEPVQGRGQIQKGPNGSMVIDDTYNASRDSILASVKTIKEADLGPQTRRWAVLGDIFEMGRYSRKEHRDTGEGLKGQIDFLIAIGDHARYYVEGAVRAGMQADQIYYFNADVENREDLENAKNEVADLLKREVRPADVILLKASHGILLETLLDTF